MSDVVSIFSKTKKVSKENKDTKAEADKDLSFEEIMQRHEENKKRMEEERKKANKSVIRSYRLKPR